ncbi:methyltransferase domain-containing protein [Ulvibacter antarcticus]|uniref:Methyltransferase family protein n=1 Tax=Ulvibacter antarcticus TaxID=442714 RepID=A0A3L9YBG0_9FLAO|nr:methyltransferase domain-containing protein [Ulvibacter antarcticus]RMA57981.1 hypothetical protein BXY75_2789 [Ulvibacter antarcticus]
MLSKILNKLRSIIQKTRRSLYVSLLKIFGISDYKRWSKTDTLDETWDERTILLAQQITPNSKVLEFGPRRLILKKNLPENCEYYNSDIIKRDDETLVIDLNKELPELPEVDFIVFSGVLEYVKDVNHLISHCNKYSKSILLSYAVTDHFSNVKNRRISGWISDLSVDDIEKIARDLKMNWSFLNVWKGQRLFRFDKR